jgi:hypothetical protein
VAELRLELSLDRASGVLAGIVASLAQNGLQLKRQQLERHADRTASLVIRVEGDAPDPAALAERLSAVRGVARVVRIEIDGRAAHVASEPVDDQVDAGDLAELLPGAEPDPAPTSVAPVPSEIPSSEPATHHPGERADAAVDEDPATESGDPWLNPRAAEDLEIAGRESDPPSDPWAQVPAAPAAVERESSDTPLLREEDGAASPAVVDGTVPPFVHSGDSASGPEDGAVARVAAGDDVGTGEGVQHEHDGENDGHDDRSDDDAHRHQAPGSTGVDAPAEDPPGGDGASNTGAGADKPGRRPRSLRRRRR